jgi:hypothetical protein
MSSVMKLLIGAACEVASAPRNSAFIAAPRDSRTNP